MFVPTQKNCPEFFFGNRSFGKFEKSPETTFLARAILFHECFHGKLVLSSGIAMLLKTYDHLLLKCHITVLFIKGVKKMKQPLEVFCKRRCSQKSCTIQRKHLRQSLFFNKVAGLGFIKEETLAQVFSCKFGEISKNTYFIEHLWATASGKTVEYEEVRAYLYPQLMNCLSILSSNS